jgi:hypothetical protein
LDHELASMIADGALHEVPVSARTGVQNVAGYFSVPKKNTTTEHRPIISLVALNKKLKKAKFKLTTVKDIALSMTQNCFLVSIDLRKAYFSVPMAPAFWKFLRIVWNDILCVAPIFHNIYICLYLHDSLVYAHFMAPLFNLMF